MAKGCGNCEKYHERSEFECLMTPGPSFGYDLLDSFENCKMAPQYERTPHAIGLEKRREIIPTPGKATIITIDDIGVTDSDATSTDTVI